MKPLDRLSEYLGAVERRLRLLALSRGAAATAAAALILTVVAVLIANQFSFSSRSVIGARLLLFIGLALAIGVALIVPVIRLNRRNAARAAELRYPQFEERLLTFTERLAQNPTDPFLPLLADDTMVVANQAAPHAVARTSWIFSFSSAALLFAAILIWLGVSGGGFLGYGTSLLWGGIPKGITKPFYNIQVDPGNRTVRKRADQLITATLSGFNAPKVRFFAKFVSGSKWEETEMRPAPSSSSYQFLIAGVPESMEYYVEAGGVHSDTYKLNVVDLPSVKNIKVTYHFPAWAEMRDQVEDPGGDLRAVEGTNAEVEIQTDRPLSTGAILLDDGTKLPLRQSGNALVASVPIKKDGLYHVAAVEGGDDVRLSEDYFIEAQKYQPPEVKITRPGRDFKATPIEEVAITVEAKDGFALKSVDLHYSVNGSPEKTIPLLQNKEAKTSIGNTLLAMEDYKLVPGDVVSVYATAKDSLKTASTDMFFIEMQPFERNYTQAQESGGGGGGGGGDDQQQNQISEREKEIITATWNQAKGRGARGTDAENASFLSGVQSKLREQAKSLSDRMKARQLEATGDSFKSFVDDMDQAVAAMDPATNELKGAKWDNALAPEQKALQFLLRAEATMRDIQVAFGQKGGGGGGGGGGATRDLQGLFDLELDTEKNQYEGAHKTQTADEKQKEVDDALQKLQQLAKRQSELDSQQKQNQQLSSEQRWQQEQLRRDAEKLKEQLQQAMSGQQQQLSRGGQPQKGQQGSAQSQPSEGGQSGQSGQSGQPSGQAGQAGQQSGQQQQQQQQQQAGQQQRNQQQQMGQRPMGDQRQLQSTLDSLEKAIESMSKAASSQQNGTPQGQAEARRAEAALQDASQALSGIRAAQSKNQIEDLVSQAEQLAQKQENVEGEMRKAYGPQGQPTGREESKQRDDKIAREKDGEIADLKKLEQGMTAAARDQQQTQRAASTKMREALSEIQQMEMERDMQRNADYIRRGLGEYVVMSESNFTQGLNIVRDKLKEVQQALGTPGKDGGKGAGDDKSMQQSLASLENFRQMLQPKGQGQQGQGQGTRPASSRVRRAKASNRGRMDSKRARADSNRDRVANSQVRGKRAKAGNNRVKAEADNSRADNNLAGSATRAKAAVARWAPTGSAHRVRITRRNIVRRCKRCSSLSSS